VGDEEAEAFALWTEVGFEPSYARYAATVGRIVRTGTPPLALAERSPFAPEQVEHFARTTDPVSATTWDTPYAEPEAPASHGGEGQCSSSWDAESIGSHRLAQVPDPGDGGPPTSDPTSTWDYRCPKCGNEWAGQPRPWRAGGMAIADARDRRSGRRAIRLVYETGEYQALDRKLRALADALGTTDLADTVAAAVRLASERVAEPGRTPVQEVVSSVASN
jgi:hypothetical protein